MDLLANVPSWGDVERNLDQIFSDLNQSAQGGFQDAQDSWNAFAHRLSNGVTQAYGYVDGHQIDHVRQAMALSYPIMQMNLTRKWASINIAEILPVLVKLVQEVVMIIGGSVMVGAAVGGAVGSLAFGAGALPGATIGGGIGLQVGNILMAALGLYAVVEYFTDNVAPCISTLSDGLATAWCAEDGLKPAGLDPSGGSAAIIQERTDRAARQLAHGQEQLVLLLLMAIATYLIRGQIRAGVDRSLESIATRSAKLQSQISNEELAAWLAKNEDQLLEYPELQIRGVTSLERLEREHSMRDFYAEQDLEFSSLEEKRRFAKTFEPVGLNDQEIREYLSSPAGEEYLKKVILADPSASDALIYERAYGQIASGSTLPVTTRITTGLVKIVPQAEKSISDFSPFFTTMDELNAAASLDTTLADALGLPVISENARYSIFEITPLTPTDVFVSKVAPTIEFGGRLTRTGGATQYLVPNRKEWSAAKIIGEINN